MDTKFIDDILAESQDRQKNYLIKINKIKDAIKTLEEEDIALPESVYGTLAYYQSEYDNEYKQYSILLKLSKHEDC
jgi:hypothetical protein